MADNCPKCGRLEHQRNVDAVTINKLISGVKGLEKEVERLEEGINDAMDYQTTAVIFATLREALEEES
jgi:hypothetical protein